MKLNQVGYRVVLDTIIMKYRVEEYYTFIDHPEQTNLIRNGFDNKVEAERFLRLYLGE